MPRALWAVILLIGFCPSRTMARLLSLLLALLWLGQGVAEASPVPAVPKDSRLPGVALAESISELTGVAISPLLGMSAVGAWEYYQASPVQRPHLPWYAHPAAWIFGFSVVGLCFLKDLLGTAAPPLVKKPLDVLELFEDKASALVATSAFVPIVMSQLAARAPVESASFAEPIWQVASAFPLDARLVTVPLAIIGFLTVWMACHSINVLITLCPFGFIDAILKLIKTALLGLVLLSTAISPFLGAAVSLILLAVACSVAPWAFRLSLFGTLFGLDLLFPGRGERRARVEEPHVFLARRTGRVPTRTLGRLRLDASGAVSFRYRPWLLLPPSILPLPPGDLLLEEGVLYPSLYHRPSKDASPRTIAIFLPRYRPHAADLALRFAPAGLQTSPTLRGWRAVRSFFAQILNLGKAPQAVP